MTTHNARPLAASTLAAAAIVAGMAVPAAAEISFVDMFRSEVYTQTGDGNTLSADGAFLNFSLFSRNANDYTSAQATFAGPLSPAVLTVTNPTTFDYSTGFYPTRAAMNADFAPGAYTLTATNGTTTDSTTFNYVADAYSSTLPYLTGTDYSMLQGVNPTAPIALHFSVDTPAPSTEGLLFLTIFDANTGDVIYDAGFQPSTTTGLTIPANALVGQTQYAYELIFSDRVTTASPGADFDAQIGFDKRTAGFFTTAATPEPACLLAALSASALLGRRRLRR